MTTDDDLKNRLDRIEEKLEKLGGSPFQGRYFGYEYKSKRQVWGMPLLHVAQGINPETGAPRIARGFIAVGNVAIGVFALGGVALGVFAFGGIGVGLFVFGGLALGLLLGLGGLATGFIALGGMAVGYFALGGMAVGVHALGGNVQDPQLIEQIKSILNSFGVSQPR